MGKEQIIIIRDNHISATIDDQKFEMSLKQFEILSQLVNSAIFSNIGVAYIDENGNLHVINQQKYGEETNDKY